MIIGTIKVCLWLIVVAVCAYMVCWVAKKIVKSFIELFSR